MKDLTVQEKSARGISYPLLFWLFLLGSVLGFVLEGVWCLLRKGFWESHSATLWGPFCIIYGLGAAAMYCLSVLLDGRHPALRFCAFALAGSGVELLSGIFQQVCFGTYSWDYSHHAFSIGGKISLSMTLLWGVLGMVFMKWVFPPLAAFLNSLCGKGWRIACGVCTTFMCVNLLMTGAALDRWDSRHKGTPPQNALEQAIDSRFDDAWMAKRYPNMKFFGE